MEKYKIAIIDNGVNSKIIKSTVENKIVIDKNNNYKDDDIKINNTDFQHGTICALVIEKYYPESILASIRVLDKDGKGVIERLVPAFNWCYMNGVIIINLSLGTTNFKDCDKLNKLINKYTYMGLIIIAATSNNGFRTYPACFSNVIGVSTWDNNSKCNDKYIHLGIDIIAPSEHRITMYGVEFNTPLSNSYAAPYVSALVAKKMFSQGISDIYTIKKYIWNKNKLSKEFSYEVDWIYRAYMTDVKSTSKEDYYFEVITGCYADVENDIDTIIIRSLDELNKIKIENKNLVYLGEDDINSIHVNGFKWSMGNKLKQILDNEYIGKGLDIPLIVLYIDNNLDEYFILNELKREFRKDGYNAYAIGSDPECILYKLEYIPNINMEKKILRNFIEAQVYYKQSDLILWSVSEEKKNFLHELYDQCSLEIVLKKIGEVITVCIRSNDTIIFEKNVYLELNKIDSAEMFNIIENYLMEDKI